MNDDDVKCSTESNTSEAIKNMKKRYQTFKKRNYNYIPNSVSKYQTSTMVSFRRSLYPPSFSDKEKKSKKSKKKSLTQ